MQTKHASLRFLSPSSLHCHRVVRSRTAASYHSCCILLTWLLQFFVPAFDVDILGTFTHGWPSGNFPINFFTSTSLFVRRKQTRRPCSPQQRPQHVCRARHQTQNVSVAQRCPPHSESLPPGRDPGSLHPPPKYVHTERI